MKPLKIGFISFLFLAISAGSALAASTITYVPQNTLNLTMTGDCASSTTIWVGADINNLDELSAYGGGASSFPTTLDITSRHYTLGNTYFAEMRCNNFGTHVADISFVYSAPPTPTPTPTPNPAYHLKPSDQTQVNTMSAGATSTILNLFITNIPIIIVFALTIMGFWFIWDLVSGMIDPTRGDINQKTWESEGGFTTDDKLDGKNLTESEIMSLKQGDDLGDIEAYRSIDSGEYNNYEGDYINGNLVGFKHRK